MGFDATAIICYGVRLDEDFEPPWGDGIDEDDIEEWWMEVNGYKELPGVFTETGSYTPELKAKIASLPRGSSARREHDIPEIDAYWDHHRAFKESMPSLPVGLEFFGHTDGHTESVLVVPGSVLREDWGPHDFEMPEVSDEAKAALLKFLEDHKIETDGEPRWMIGAYYG
jgi:hypothetical protein